jgi:hypothetical protein
LAGVAILMDVEGVSDESTKKVVEKEKKWSNWLLIDIDLFIININILKFILVHCSSKKGYFVHFSLPRFY